MPLTHVLFARGCVSRYHHINTAAPNVAATEVAVTGSHSQPWRLHVHIHVRAHPWERRVRKTRMFLGE